MKVEIDEIEILFVEMKLKYVLKPFRSSLKNYEGLNKIYNKNVKEMLLLLIKDIINL